MFAPTDSGHNGGITVARRKACETLKIELVDKELLVETPEANAEGVGGAIAQGHLLELLVNALLLSETLQEQQAAQLWRSGGSAGGGEGAQNKGVPRNEKISAITGPKQAACASTAVVMHAMRTTTHVKH